jgi:hypothetical protein
MSARVATEPRTTRPLDLTDKPSEIGALVTNLSALFGRIQRAGLANAGRPRSRRILLAGSGTPIVTVPRQAFPSSGAVVLQVTNKSQAAAVLDRHHSLVGSAPRWIRKRSLWE